MVPKHQKKTRYWSEGFRAVLFRMVPKLSPTPSRAVPCFRAVLFRMVPKHLTKKTINEASFRAVLFRMVPKLTFCSAN